MAGTGVIDGKPQAPRAERGDGRIQRLEVVDTIVLGNLQDDPVQRRPVSASSG